MSRMLEIDDSALVVVDLQGKLAELMHDKESLFNNIGILIKSAHILEIPIIWCQQVPDALGPTVPQIAELLEKIEPVNKASFSCCRNEGFADRLNSLDKKQILLCGIEAHICIYQTARELGDQGFEVHVVADAISSRAVENKSIAIERLKCEGISVGSTEMVLFELLKTARHPKFRQIAGLVK